VDEALSVKLRALGATGLLVSPLGLGTVKLGRREGLRYPRPFEIPDDREARRLLQTARACGINLLDTAPAYGSSEERLGRLLCGVRSDWVVCTKTGEEFDGGVSRFDFSASHTRASVERSLHRLGTDYLDIVLVHSDGGDLRILEECEALDELARLKREGLVRAIGVSTKTVAGGIAAARRCDVLMVSYNLWHQAERAVLDACAENGTGVLIKKALASGRLCSDDAGLLQQSFDLVYAHPAVSSVITGTTDTVHLLQNVAAAERAMDPCRDG
jgi:aryl-alcohol dehydrogenase-like predicted oxidoreductase